MIEVIAEISLNHNGDPDIARRLIDACKMAGANFAKFQMRSYSLYRSYSTVHEDIGTQYIIDYINRTQLSQNTMFSLFDYCHEIGIEPLCTPFDIESLNGLKKYGIENYKIASADLTNHPLIETAIDTGKRLIMSTGMASETEIIETLRLLRRRKEPIDFVFMHCNSTYPAPFADLNLRYIKRLREICNCPIGYSGHERGYCAVFAAVTLGASVIEKHITLDRNQEGNDHKVSLLPDEFAAMVKGIHEIEESLGSEKPREISSGERMNRISLGKSLIANKMINKGEAITKDKIRVCSPGSGLQPNRYHELLGRISVRDIAAGDFFHESDLKQYVTGPSIYKFNRPWGIPVRFHDWKQLYEMSNPDFLEFHLGYRDLNLDPDKYLSKIDSGFTVHSPDIFVGDFLLDLANTDSGIVNRSIDELQRVIDLTREMKKYFNEQCPRIIVSMGGFSRDEFLPRELHTEMYKRIGEAIEELDTEGIELLAQTLPPFPWYFGGQLFLNLFIHPPEMIQFCEDYKIGLCLDISHAKMTCNHFGYPFYTYMGKLNDYVKHIHLADARGVSGEGIQIDEGEIDKGILCCFIDSRFPDISFIPEIWRGHINSGEGFWIALNRLEGFL